MKLKLLSFFLLISGLTYGQGKQVIAGNPVEEKPVYVTLTPAGADTALEVRSAMRIAIVHMEEGSLAAYRLQDQTFLISSPDEKRAKAIVGKLSSKFQYSKVEMLHAGNYADLGFTPVQVGGGRTDPTFPKIYVTGDKALDNRSYRIEKLTWLAEHPIPEETTTNNNQSK